MYITGSKERGSHMLKYKNIKRRIILSECNLSYTDLKTQFRHSQNLQRERWMPLGSVIIINYNGQALIGGCLRALERQSLKDFEVIIVDNGSSDSSLCEIQNFLNESPIAPRVKLVPLDENLGFAGGNIVGLNHTNKSEFIALLNNDAEPELDWFENLISGMNSEPGVGACASKLIVYGTDIIDSAGVEFSAFFKAFNRGEGKKTSSLDTKEYVFGACGGAVLYRRKMIDEIGFLDEDFFLIHEDIDLNFRAQLQGWKIMYIPTANCNHKVRSTIGKMSDSAVYYTLRNSEFVKIKNIPVWFFLRYLLWFILGAISEFIFFAVKHGYLILYFKAKLDAVKMLPVMLKKRRLILKTKTISNKDLMKITMPLFGKDFLRRKFKKLLFD